MKYIIDFIKLILFTKKHKYEKYEQETLPGGFTYHVYKCACGKEIHLDRWQIESLPVTMKYGCKI